MRLHFITQRPDGIFNSSNSCFRIIFSLLIVRKSSVTGPERDVYTGNSGAWQQSLRGASRLVGSMTTWPASDITLCAGRRGRALGADPGQSGHSQHRSHSRGDSGLLSNNRGGQWRTKYFIMFPRFRRSKYFILLLNSIWL